MDADFGGRGSLVGAVACRAKRMEAESNATVWGMEMGGFTGEEERVIVAIKPRTRIGDRKSVVAGFSPCGAGLKLPPVGCHAPNLWEDLARWERTAKEGEGAAGRRWSGARQAANEPPFGGHSK